MNFEGKLPGISTQIGLQRIGQSVERYIRFLQAFYQACPMYRDQLQEAICQNNYENLHVSAHNLYGVASTIGASNLADLCSNLLKAIERPDSSQLEMYTGEIFTHLEEIMLGIETAGILSDTKNQNYSTTSTQRKENLSTEYVPETQAAPKVAAKRQLLAEHILLVEDEAVLAEIICSKLEPHVGEITHYSTAQDAIEFINALSRTKPDILICDLKLGNDSGFDVARHIRKVRPNMPIVLISGQPYEKDKLPYRDELNPFVLLKKPFPLGLLLDQIASFAQR